MSIFSSKFIYLLSKIEVFFTILVFIHINALRFGASPDCSIASKYKPFEIISANCSRSLAFSIKVSNEAAAQLIRSRIVWTTLLIIFLLSPSVEYIYPISLPQGLTFFILVSFGHQQISQGQDNCFLGSRYSNNVTRKLDTN